MNTKLILGQNIKALREKMGLTQNDLADYVGVRREVISYYENGSRDIPLENLNKIADLFGIELADLMTDDAIIRSANIAFAFRADSFGSDDLNSIAEFRKIVKNYIKMTRLKEQHESKL